MKTSSIPTPGWSPGSPDSQVMGVCAPSFEEGPENIIAGRSDLKDRRVFLRSEGQETGLQIGWGKRPGVRDFAVALAVLSASRKPPCRELAGGRPGGSRGGPAQPVDGSSLGPVLPAPGPGRPLSVREPGGAVSQSGCPGPPAGWQGTAEGGRSAQATVWAPRDLTRLSVCLSVCRWTAPSARAAPPKASSTEAPSPGPPAPCLPPCAPRPAPAPPKPCSRSPTRSPRRAPHAA